MAFMIRNWADQTFAALRHRDYRVLWIGTSVSFLAFSMSWVVQAVVAYDLTGKNGSVGIVSLGMGVSMLVVGPFGGVFADRMSKRGMLIWGQVVLAAVFGATGVLILGDAISIPLLVLSTFLMGLVFSFIAPARSAWTGELLEGPLLANGVALQQVAMTATRIVGPFLAGAIVAVPAFGTGGGYVVMGALMLLVVVTLAKMPPSAAPLPGERPSPLADMKEGLAHVGSRPRLALLCACFIAVVLAGYSYQVVLPGLLENELGRESSDMAWLLGMAGIAGLLGTVGAAGVAGGSHAWPVQLAGGLSLGVGLLLMGVVPSFGLALPTMLLVGLG
jgi:MFS family permease